MPDSASKRCTKCGEIKPVADFGLLASSPDDRRSRCRECQNHPSDRRTGGEPGEDNALRQYHRDYYRRNREKLLEQKRLRDANLSAEEKRRRARQYYLRGRYGLDLSDWMLLWEQQGRCCYLCGDPLVADEAFLEHDHTCCPGYRPCGLCTRGLTHSACNTAIGLAGDDPVRLHRMADALEAAQAAVAQRKAAASGERI